MSAKESSVLSLELRDTDKFLLLLCLTLTLSRTGNGGGVEKVGEESK